MYSTLNINWEQLSLVVGGDDCPADEEMQDLFRLFVDDASQRLRGLCTAGRSSDRTAVAKEAHKIRGAASSFGFERVAVLLRTIEMQSADLSQQSIDDMLREALAAFAQSVQEVHDCYPALSA